MTRIEGDAIGSNINTRGHARIGDVSVGKVDRKDLIRRIDELARLVDELRDEARKTKPSKKNTKRLLGELSLTRSIEDLTKAFEELF